MTALCSRASGLDTLDEGLHILVVRSLVKQGRDAAALERYEMATDLLYRSLGVTPSAELRDLYTAIMATEKSLETDLAVIQQSLKETAIRPGPLCASTASSGRPTGWRPGGPPATGPASIWRF